MRFDNYETDGFFDELFEKSGLPRAEAQLIVEQINALPAKDLKRRQKAAELALLEAGITFNVYSKNEGKEKIFPFDIVPRIVDSAHWEDVEAGLKQRIRALNLFIDDIYNKKQILKDKIVPEEMILTAAAYRKQCEGFSPPKKVWIHISGVDLIRDESGAFFILEDNLRCPSGVSYVLENRMILKQTFPKAFKSMTVKPVDDYPERLLETLRSMCPDKEHPVVVLLTPGTFNSAYFEHSFLAQKMGIQLVEGQDLVVRGGRVTLRTTKGFAPVDVIYRRVDDDFIDPNEFRKDSILGVKGIMEVYRNKKVVLANAVGTSIADDKAVYAYTPKIIKYYLNEDPILPIVPTYVCSYDDQRKYVLENLAKMVVKPVSLSGGYGMLVGPKSTKKEQAKFASLIKKSPREYIAQPTINLSRAPVIHRNQFSGRHVDLRPYTLYGDDIYVMPGGLTRVALKPGSLVVNSSQGGGSKDTWVVKKLGVERNVK